MVKNLVIVESPAKAKTVSKYLDDSYTVKASMGHVVDLPTNDLGVDVDNDFNPTYKVTKDKTKIVADLKKAAKEADFIWLATDEDREGEAIAWHILNTLKIKEDEYNRIVFHEITKTAILKSIENPRKIDNQLVNAQQSRRIIDRLVGYKLSPLLWKKVRKGLSAGRVQSVAVRFVVEKEEEINSFVPKESWDVKGNALNKDKVSIPILLNKVDDKKVNLLNEETVMKTIETCFGDIKFKPVKGKKDTVQYECVIPKGTELLVSKVNKKVLTRQPAPPFTTSTLQQEAHRKHGYAVGQTMRLAQKLYEGIDLKQGRVGLITYMRTDSLNLADESLLQISSYIQETYGKDYSIQNYRTYKTKTKGAQEAHEAIRPVDIRIVPETLKGELEPQLLKLYTLIWKRTIATQMQEAEIENTTISMVLDKNKKVEFTASGEVITFDGFMKLYIEDTDDENEDEDVTRLPIMEKGEKVTLDFLNAIQKFSRPPARYTEASLVKKLESEGIGRPSTYAPTISTVIARGYIEKDKKHLFPTELAIIVTKFLLEYFDDILNYKFTANLEESFDDIALGNKDWKKIINEFYVPFNEKLEFTYKNAKKYAEETDEKCPDCGKDLIIRMSKYGKFLSCSSYPECKYTRNVGSTDEKENPEPEKVGENCPQCGSEMIYKTGRFGRFIACSNYPTCKHIKKQKTVLEGVKCPKCGGDVLEKRTKRGRTFFGCDAYPKCDFAAWKKEDIK
ncbi:MAG: DNA topoisomerase I [Candidatus Margulisbacteria bacterium GWF2_35_9]|nr:MAG: DNA topoisomerase I [Candidatus Margulisbacteria bacterium GWF2_35_9]